MIRHHAQPPRQHGRLHLLAGADDATSSAVAEKWAADLLRQCARAVSAKDSVALHRLLWMLNELASPYGDGEQRLAYHFLQALFCRVTGSGELCCRTSLAVAAKAHSFDAARRVALRFQEASPWDTFGHVAANGTILEAVEGEQRIHIVDIGGDTLCTQWPTLLEALATRSDHEAPHLRLTVVAVAPRADAVIGEVGQRMEKFARLMGVPFEFRALGRASRLGSLAGRDLALRDGEAVVVNCAGALRRVASEERDAFVRMLGSLRPRVVTVVEEEADFGGEFGDRFEECLRFYCAYFEMLEGSFGVTSEERLALERDCGRGIIGVVGCDGGDGGDRDCERRERAWEWCRRLRRAFSVSGFSVDVVDDLKALLRRYRAAQWSLSPAEAEASGMYLTWNQQPVVWACAWKSN